MSIELRGQLYWQSGSGASAKVSVDNVTAWISLPKAGHASVAYLMSILEFESCNHVGHLCNQMQYCNKSMYGFG